jgi:CRISPR/Cas system-associated protein Csm6
MANFIVYVEQVEYEEYEVVVEVKSIKSVEEEWEGISDVVDEYCYNDATEDLDDDGTIFRSD